MATTLAVLREMLHAVQRQAALYGLKLHLSKTLIRLGDALRQLSPNMEDIEGRPIQFVESEKILGFELGAKVTMKNIVRMRGRTMPARMNQYEAIWQSDSAPEHFLVPDPAAVCGLDLQNASDVPGVDVLQNNKITLLQCQEMQSPNAFVDDQGLVLAQFVAHRQHSRVLPNSPDESSVLLGHILHRPYADPDRLCCFEPGMALES